jgi:WD40-like Beta Propeller Repeat
VATHRYAHRPLRITRLPACLLVMHGAFAVHGQTPPQPCDTVDVCLLSAGLPPGDVQSVQVSPDGTRAVFVRRGADSIDRLYSVLVDGSELPVALTAATVTDPVRDVTISPDGTRVVYVANADPDGERALFSVPIAGPAAANMRLGTDVAREPLISPDSRKVVYAPDDVLDRLRAVPIEGPAQAGVRLTAPFPDGFELKDAVISANGKSVVYSAGDFHSSSVILYRVPLTLSPEPNPPTAMLSEDDSVAPYSFVLAPNDGRVVYLADPTGVNELFSVTLGGAASCSLSR